MQDYAVDPNSEKFKYAIIDKNGNILTGDEVSFKFKIALEFGTFSIKTSINFSHDENDTHFFAIDLNTINPIPFWDKNGLNTSLMWGIG